MYARILAYFLSKCCGSGDWSQGLGMVDKQSTFELHKLARILTFELVITRKEK